MKTHRVMVVTGASAGAGRAVVCKFAKREAWLGLALVARGKDGMEASEKEVGHAGSRPLVLQTEKDDY